MEWGMNYANVVGVCYLPLHEKSMCRAGGIEVIVVCALHVDPGA